MYKAVRIDRNNMHQQEPILDTSIQYYYLVFYWTSYVHRFQGVLPYAVLCKDDTQQHLDSYEAPLLQRVRHIV